MQRLFSNFANGWPGTGLLLQRILTAILLTRFTIIEPSGLFPASAIPQIVGACAALLLLIGLWTPIVGAVIAAIELWVAIASSSNPWIAIVLATLGATIAMIGPGAWSIDARLFGRKHIET